MEENSIKSICSIMANGNLTIDPTNLGQTKKRSSLNSLFIAGTMSFAFAAAGPVNIQAQNDFINNSDIELVNITPTTMLTHQKIRKRFNVKKSNRNYMSEEEWAEYFEKIPESDLSIERGTEQDFIKANSGKILSQLERW